MTAATCASVSVLGPGPGRGEGNDAHAADVTAHDLKLVGLNGHRFERGHDPPQGRERRLRGALLRTSRRQTRELSDEGFDVGGAEVADAPAGEVRDGVGAHR